MPDKPPPEKPCFFPQESPNTCAVACLRMVLSAYGVNVPEAELAVRARTDQFGTEMGNLVKAALDLGFRADAFIFDLKDLQRVQFPIVYLDGPTLGRKFMMHAVVVTVIESTITILDPSAGEVNLDVSQFCDAWSIAGSYAVVIEPAQV